jgi:hypothetical protein
LNIFTSCEHIVHRLSGERSARAASRDDGEDLGLRSVDGRVLLLLGRASFSEFHPGEKVLEGAFGHGGARIFSSALPLRLVEENVRSAHQTVLERGIKHLSRS